MKPNAVTPRILSKVMPRVVNAPLPKPISNLQTLPSDLNSKKVNPPDEETLDRLNAIVKQYPFCIYYRQKKNDPL
jgi:hypothetical protein